MTGTSGLDRRTLSATAIRDRVSIYDDNRCGIQTRGIFGGCLETKRFQARPFDECCNGAILRFVEIDINGSSPLPPAWNKRCRHRVLPEAKFSNKNYGWTLLLEEDVICLRKHSKTDPGSTTNLRVPLPLNRKRQAYLTAERACYTSIGGNVKLKSIAVLAIAVGSLGFLSIPAFAGPSCISAVGRMTETVITPFGSPNDPLGRNVLVVQGSLNSLGTSILTSVGPGPVPGTLGATTRHVFVVSVTDQLTATGVAVFTPIPNTNNVNVVLTLSVTGGTGKFASATGTIIATGIGFNFFPLPPGPSTANQSSYVYQLTGSVCGLQ